MDRWRLTILQPCVIYEVNRRFRSRVCVSPVGLTRVTTLFAPGAHPIRALTSTDANEIFTGKAGADSFVFKAGFGKDVIRDFDEGMHRGHDYLRFSKALFSDFDSLMSAMQRYIKQAKNELLQPRPQAVQAILREAARLH